MRSMQKRALRATLRANHDFLCFLISFGLFQASLFSGTGILQEMKEGGQVGRISQTPGLTCKFAPIARSTFRIVSNCGFAFVARALYKLGLLMPVCSAIFDIPMAFAMCPSAT